MDILSLLFFTQAEGVFSAGLSFSFSCQGMHEVQSPQTFHNAVPSSPPPCENASSGAGKASCDARLFSRSTQIKWCGFEQISPESLPKSKLSEPLLMYYIEDPLGCTLWYSRKDIWGRQWDEGFFGRAFIIFSKTQTRYRPTRGGSFFPI